MITWNERSWVRGWAKEHYRTTISGAQVNMEPPETGKPLMLACGEYRPNVELLKTLIKHSALVDI
jgi:hypothetical protein